MIRFSVVFFAFMITCLDITAQDSTKFTRAVSFNVSLGVPVGNFASIEKGNNNESGFALPGFGFDFNYFLMRRTSNYGLMASFRYQNYSYNIDGAVEAHKPPAPGVWYGEGDSWKTMSLMAGGYIGLNHNKNFAVEARMQCGIQLTLSKDRSISGFGSGGSYKAFYTLQDAAASSFCYRAGLGIRSKIAQKRFFLASVDFNGATPIISYTSEFKITNVVDGTNAGTFNQPMNAVVISAGFLFVL